MKISWKINNSEDDEFSRSITIDTSEEDWIEKVLKKFKKDLEEVKENE